MMIQDDETSIAALLTKISLIPKDHNGHHSVRQNRQIGLWKGSILNLGRGLEGLRLKRDALSDGQIGPLLPNAT